MVARQSPSRPGHGDDMPAPDDLMAGADRFTAAAVTMPDQSPGPALEGRHEDCDQSPDSCRHSASAPVSALSHGNEVAGPAAGPTPRRVRAGRPVPLSLADAPSLDVPKCRFLE